MTWVASGVSAHADGEPCRVVVSGLRVALVHAEGEWWAIEDRCSHADCSFLDDGEFDGTTVVCDCHGSEFDVRTGEVLAPPATDPIHVYRTRVEAGLIEVEW